MIEKIYKLVIAGDGGVGKTSLTNKYITGVFNPKTEVTIGVDFFIKEVELENIGTIRLQIWDFAGEERFRQLLPTYVNGANGIIFLYAINSPSSLQHLENWLPILRYYDENVPILVVGNKLDLKHQRKVLQNEAIEFAKKFGCHGFAEVSAKDGTNVNETFVEITKLMWKMMEQEEKSVKEVAF